MTFSLRSAVVLAVSIALLAMAPVSPEAANIIFLSVGVASTLLMRRASIDVLRRPLIWMCLVALALLGLAYVLGAGTLEGLVGLAFFAPVFVIWPLVAASSSTASDPTFRVQDWVLLFGTLALVGVVGAGVTAIDEVATTLTTRAGGTVANPIHFADVALLVGGVSLLGLFAGKGAGRYVFLLGPAFAAIAVVLSGTRGAVVAFAVMGLVALAGAAILRLLSRRQLLLIAIAAIVLLVAAIVLGASQLSGIQRVLEDLADVARMGVPGDESTSLRLQMYLGGWRAFLEAPLFGHGPLAFINVARDLADVPFDNAPHLHNDLADFAASAGIVGLAAYALLLAAPIVEVLRMPHVPLRAPLLVVVATLIVGYFVMGLTNAMFGILNVTTCFAGICVIVGVLTDSRAGDSTEVSST